MTATPEPLRFMRSATAKRGMRSCVSGSRVAGALAGMRLDEASGPFLAKQSSGAPRNGYKRGDRAMRRIVCQVEAAAVAWSARKTGAL